MGTIKTGRNVLVTLVAVTLVYAAPWILAATGSAAPRMSVESVELEEDRFADVVWIPAAPEPPKEAPAETDEVGSTTGETTLASTQPEPSVVAQAVSADGVAMAGPPVADGPTTRAVKRVRRARKVRRRAPPRELSKKQKRRKKRRKRRNERLAKQPQCHDLIDQIVKVSDEEWYVGKDLAGCYRAHPRQFMRIGGMQWVDDKNDKRIGLKIYVSTRDRGDIARAAGFRRGDVLRSLNGVPLRSTAGSGFAAMQLLGNKAKLKFLRNGKERRVILRVVGDRKLDEARRDTALARLAP